MTTLSRFCLIFLVSTVIVVPAAALDETDASRDAAADKLLEQIEQVRAELADGQLAADLADSAEAVRMAALERQQILARTELALNRHLDALERIGELQGRGEAARQKLDEQLAHVERDAPLDFQEVTRYLQDALGRTRSVEAARTLVQISDAQIVDARADLDAALQQRRRLTDALKQAQAKGNGVDKALRAMRLADARVREMRVTLESAMADGEATEANLLMAEQLAGLARQLGSRAVRLSPIGEDEQKRILAGLVDDMARTREQTAVAAEQLRLRQMRAAEAETSLAEAAATAEERSLAAASRAEAARYDLKVRQLRTRLLSLDAIRRLWEMRFRLQEERARSLHRDAVRLIEETEGLAKTVRDIASSEVRGVRQDMKNLDAQLAAWDPGFGNRGAVVARRDALRAMSQVYDEFLAGANELESQLDLARIHVEYLMSGRTVIDSAAELAGMVSGWFWDFWRYELFTVEETIEVDGQTITGSVGITVWKVVSALLMVTLGVWLAMGLGRLLRALMVSRGRSETTAQLGYRVFMIVVVFVLFVLALNLLNIPFTTFSFLGGALAIGVGFGAQNLVNNFISGVILLMERPVEIGHVIEVDGIRGRVVKIGARFSQIRRFDGVDMLIPNSLLLEQKVINLTLEDQNLRVTVKVGVAYGSSTRESSRQLLAAAEEHGLVLKDPAPFVIFEEFGESSLVFTLYFWVAQEGTNSWLSIASDIRHMIDRKLREAGITIAFPQRDVHLDVSGPVDVRMNNGPGPAHA